jgi:putative hydrolase of the HAD superfamily
MKKSAKTAAIRAVLFDLGKVILDFNFAPAFERFAAKTGLSIAEIRDFFSVSGLEVLYDGGIISSREFYRQVKKGLGHDLSYSEFENIWNDIFTPIPSMIDLVQRLHGRYRLVLVSNTNAMHYRHVRRRFPVFNRFERHILSFREKVRKPDQRIYARAARACGARPAQIFYIDDREDLTQAASEMGFQTFTFKKNLDQLLKKMRLLGILN